jgi:hypothetical protein
MEVEPLPGQMEKKYSGQYVNGVREGEGTFDWPNGKKYIGMWRNGLQNGKGKVIFNKL